MCAVPPGQTGSPTTTVIINAGLARREWGTLRAPARLPQTTERGVRERVAAAVVGTLLRLGTQSCRDGEHR